MASWPSNWIHRPTAQCRYPAICVEELGAIAHWADQQEDPSAVLELLLSIGAIALWVQKQEDPKAAIKSVLQTIEGS